jgi:MOSC domain-containing protein YiiM
LKTSEREVTQIAQSKDESPDTRLEVEISIPHLFISSSHNFFGHHGHEPGSSPNTEVPEIECLAGRGIRGDRFLDYRDDYKGQVTFFSIEVFEDICGQLGIHGLSASVVRRNIITKGVDLNQLISRKFRVQGLEFLGICECKPCYWMDRAIAPGAEKLLQGRGGLRAKVLSGGTLRSHQG